ncbi:MAG: alpha/beta hydrolase [Elusimicrobia bacterium]|nr:alpha/beta hydrolase [Elusimicrobiota bacterium]
MTKSSITFFALLLTALSPGAGAAKALEQLPGQAPDIKISEVSSPMPVPSVRAAGLALVRSIQSKYWERIECYQDTARPFAIESALNKSRHENPEVVAAFGSAMPAASTFLLHYGPRWSTNTGKTVILAHGASDNATRAWAAPLMMMGDANAPGLLQALEAKNYRVFAVTFPHKHGSLFYEEQYLADAIELARQATGANKVILIGHSAGGLAARAYVSSYRLLGAWTSYRNDVEQLITLATPHRGQDFAFRHPEFNYFFMKDDMAANAPMSWDKVLAYGTWQDTFEFSIYSDNFPMQQQVLYNWTGKYPVNAMSPDNVTTMAGGQGFVSHSLGINSAMMKGGNFMATFKAYPVPADISVTVIAGNNNKIDGVPQTESDGPSDGLVFLESASHTADLTSPARKEPINKLIVNENHLTMTYSPAMMKMIPGLLK